MNRVSHLSFFVIVLACMAGRCFAGALADDVDKILHDKLLAKARVGVYVMRLGSSPADSASLLQINATQPFTPASNLKVVTTSAALQTLGRFQDKRTEQFHALAEKLRRDYEEALRRAAARQ